VDAALPKRYHSAKAVDFTRHENKCCFKDCKVPSAVNKTDGSRHFYCELHSGMGPDATVHENEHDLTPSSRGAPLTSNEDEIDGGDNLAGIDDQDKDKDKDKDKYCDKGHDVETDDDTGPDADADAAPDPGPVTCACDLLIVMGTSLAVAPVAGLVDEVHWLCPRLLINREVVHERGGPRPEWPPQIGPDNGFMFDQQGNYRDVACLQDCDDGVRVLAGLLGWEHELDELVAAGAAGLH
jgi:hypothetical protein